MKLFTGKCPVEGCTFTAQHAKQNYVNVLIGKHKRKAHGIVSPHQAKYGGAQPQPGEIVAGALPQARKKRGGDLPRVNFCPDCGCNLHAVAAAMTLGRKQ